MIDFILKCCCVMGMAFTALAFIGFVIAGYAMMAAEEKHE